MSNKIQKTIEINAKVKASLEGMEKTVGELERGLEKQKFDLSKNSGLSKLIKDYKAAKAELDELMSGDVIARTDIKKAEQLGGKVSKLYKQIGKSFEDLRAGSDDTFRKLFPDSFTAKISKGTKAIENFFSKLDSKTVKEGRLDEVRKDLTRLSDELDGLKNRRLKIEVDIDKKGVKDELDRINKDLEQMRENFKKKLIPEEKRDSQGRTQTERLNSSVSTWSNKLAQDTDARKNLKVQSLSKSQSSQISKLEGQLVDAQGANLANIEKKRLDALYAEQTKRATIAKTPGARDTSRNRREYGGVTDKELAAQIAASEKELQRLRAIADKIDDIKQQPQRAYDAAVKKLETQIKTDRTNLEKAERALEAHTTQREDQEAVASQKADDFMAGKQVAEATQAEIDALKALNDEKQKNLDLEKKLKEEKSFDSQKTKDSAIAKKDSSIEKKKLEIQELENTIKNLANDTNFDAIFKKLKELGVNTEGIDKTRAGLEGIKKDLESLDENTLKEIREALNQMGVDAKDTDTKVDTLTQGVEQLGDTDKDLKRAENEMENLKNQVLQFFSITNAIQLFKRTVQSALNTVKELDAVMTETAVVTDFTVGDMWEKLPQYSKEASALGASIRDLYSATTLYYQQGLQTEAAMGVGIETMKMARIANMEAADATTAMTAALRGFNMEVNELNAQRVNDVYSELAAITAADTSQIATAMSKTASIAASANMEFETTSALLAQIIETTQEAPETAGTAMKTIIARFTEVKELFSEGMLTGEDEEGEEININKIDAALKTVGISLKDFLNGSKGIDDIFLELASKWNDLDLATQRYIATTAAGSRQQSRFIAMMSNYERTMELVNAANNSAGASQEQFDKTLESMEAKLQKLKNAWDQFAMDLANNEILKGAVDVLTGTLETVNKLTESLSGGNGLIKSVISLMTVIGALKGGKSLFDNFIGNRVAQIGEVDLGEGKKGTITLGKGIQKQTESEGRGAGQAFITGWQRALQQGKKGGLKEGIKGILGETEIFSSEKIAKTLDLDELEKRINSLASLDTSFDLEFDNSKLFEAQNILNKIKTGELDFGDAAARLEELGVDITNIGQKTEQVSDQMKTFKVDFQGVGIAATGVGTAISLLGELFDNLGMDVLAEKTKKLGTVITGVGATFMMLGPMINKLGISIGTTGLYFGAAGKKALAAGLQAQLGWWPLIAIFIAIAGAVAILVGAFIAARNASPEYQLKQASEAADEAAEAADKAAESYNNLKFSLESIEQKEDVLDGLIVGTNEWKDAVSELNNQILELLAIYPELAQFISSEGGVLTISAEGKDFITNKERQNKTNAEALNIGEQIDKVIAQKAVDYSNLDRRLIQYEWENVYETDQNGRQYVADVKQVENKQLTEELAKGLASGTITRDDERLAFLNSYEDAYEDFLAFGRALLTSDQAISTFTDSLLTAATANADVSEKFKSQIGGMYNEEMIDKLITKYETTSGLPTEEDKRQYASMKNYTYEGGNKFKDSEGNEKTVGLQEIKEQLAPVKAQQEMTKAIAGMESVFSKLQSSSSGLERAFANVVSKADGMGLTFENLKDLTDFETSVTKDEEGNVTGFTGDLEQIYAKVAQFYDPEAFYSLIAEALTQAELAKTQSAKKLKSIGLGDLNRGILSDAQIDNQAMFNLANNLYDVFLTSGKDATVGLGQEIDSILKDLSPEDAQIFADALGMIDWSDTDSIEGLSDILLQLEFDSDAAGVNIEAFEKQIIEAAKATKIFNLDKIKEEIGAIEDLVKDLEDRKDTERTFTKEERDLMIGADSSLTGQFVATGIDEFTYVGDSIGTLITALDANTAALLSEYGEQVTHNAEMSDKWQNLVDNGAMWTNGQNEYQVLSSIAQSGSLEGYNIEGVIGIMEKAGMGVDSGRSLGGYTPSQLAEIIMADYAQYGSSQARQENITAYDDYNTNLEQIRLSKMSGQDILNDKQGSNTNKEEVLDAKLATEGLTEEYEATTKALKEQNSALASNEKLLKASITDAKSYEDKLADLAQVYDDNKDALKETNKGTREYQQALTNLTKAAKEAFGDNITEDFVENNLDLFKDWYKGAEGSADKLRSALVDSLLEASNETESEVSRIRNIVSGLDGLDFDIYGHADASQLFSELAAVMGSAEEAARAMEILGYSVTWEPNGTTYMMVPDPDNPTRPRAIEIPNYKAVVTDGLGNRAGANKSSYGGGKGGGGGGGGGGSKTKWENPYDEFYNTVEKINEELRTREKLERRYQNLLNKTSTKASDLVKNAREQLASLEEERKTREYLLKGRERQMADIEREYNNLGKYAWYNEEKQVIEINWTKIEALDGSTNEKLTSRIEEYIEKLEEQQDLIEEEQDSIAEIEDATKEIREQGKDEYFDLESQIKEALEQARQEEIDKLSAINDSINDTNSRLIDAMQSSIDKYRQDRENERTEEELSDKQRRLAYLQQDTSGANALEIMQLQEEIDQGMEDYTDQLIDQKINDLQEQNDKAAEQREKQIDLMQAQLDHYLDSELVWADIYELMNGGIGPDGIIAGSALEQLLMEGASFEAMSYLEKMKWLEELENNVAKAVQWLMEGNSTEALMAIGDLNKGQKIEFTTADGEKVSGTLDEAGNVITDSGEKYEGVYRTYNGAFVTQENYIKPEPPKPEPQPDPESQPESEKPKAPKLTKDIKRGVSAAIWNGNYGWGVGGTRSKRLSEVFGANDIQRNYVDKYVTSGYSGSLSDYSYINMRRKFKQYKTGGLADFTGPAWLDGTKSKPEYILNAEQTKSFFELVDVLSGLKGGTNQSSQITGDSIYDVDINVESIGSDYDVEKLATTIKRMINDDARYRNNNAINLQR